MLFINISTLLSIELSEFFSSDCNKSLFFLILKVTAKHYNKSCVNTGFFFSPVLSRVLRNEINRIMSVNQKASWNTRHNLGKS